MIVSKAVKMANMMNIPVLGIVENMSYFICDSCGKEHRIFGDSHVEQIAQRHGIASVARLPIQPALAAACDNGGIELLEPSFLARLENVLSGDIPILGVIKGEGPAKALTDALGLSEKYAEAAARLRRRLREDPDTLVIECGRYDENALRLARQWVEEYLPGGKEDL